MEQEQQTIRPSEEGMLFGLAIQCQGMMVTSYRGRNDVVNNGLKWFTTNQLRWLAKKREKNPLLKDAHGLS